MGTGQGDRAFVSGPLRSFLHQYTGLCIALCQYQEKDPLVSMLCQKNGWIFHICIKWNEQTYIM